MLANARRERGSAPVDSLFGILFVLLFALGTIQVALFLYARNVLMSAAHEAARAAVERGRDGSDAQNIAVNTVRRAAGGLVRDLDVAVSISQFPSAEVRIEIRGIARPLGPVPIKVPLSAAATARRAVVVP